MMFCGIASVWLFVRLMLIGDQRRYSTTEKGSRNGPGMMLGLVWIP